jgi:hypothetical protein
MRALRGHHPLPRNYVAGALPCELRKRKPRTFPMSTTQPQRRFLTNASIALGVALMRSPLASVVLPGGLDENVYPTFANSSNQNVAYARHPCRFACSVLLYSCCWEVESHDVNDLVLISWAARVREAPPSTSSTRSRPPATVTCGREPYLKSRRPCRGSGGDGVGMLNAVENVGRPSVSRSGCETLFS